MKTSIDYLPKNKQDELLKVIVPIICAQEKIEIIILFGSYARNDWVEEKYDDTHYRKLCVNNIYFRTILIPLQNLELFFRYKLLNKGLRAC